MPAGDEIKEELKPSTRPILACGPAKVPKISYSCEIPFPNLNEIMANYIKL
jgi:hypothetical protein